jgi:hypothetical protein
VERTHERPIDLRDPARKGLEMSETSSRARDIMIRALHERRRRLQDLAFANELDIGGQEALAHTMKRIDELEMQEYEELRKNPP